MSDDTCSIDGCSGSIRSRGYCYAHYMKAWRYGTPTPNREPKWQDLRGRRFGHLVVVERYGHGWTCRCDCGAQTFTRSGDLNRGTVTSCGDRTRHHRRDDIEYGSAHCRVRSDRGPASDHSCVDCGEPAHHWSYNHDDPDERLSSVERIEGLPFSLDPAHYSPRCVPCHKRFDLDHIHHTQALEHAAY